MIIFKTLMFILGAITLVKAINEGNLERAYDYFFISTIMFSLVFLVQEI